MKPQKIRTRKAFAGLCDGELLFTHRDGRLTYKGVVQDAGEISTYIPKLSILKELRFYLIGIHPWDRYTLFYGKECNSMEQARQVVQQCRQRLVEKKPLDDILELYFQEQYKFNE